MILRHTHLMYYLKPDTLQEPSRKWQCNDSVEDLEGKNDGNPSDPSEGDGDWHRPLKLQASQGQVAARHYKNSVKEILKLATGLFRARLVAQNIYPDRDYLGKRGMDGSMQTPCNQDHPQQRHHTIGMFSASVQYVCTEHNVDHDPHVAVDQ